MIEVNYYRKYNRVTVTGHAQSAPAGEDLVCAAASILCYTLADRVINLENSGQACNGIVKLEEGNAEIQCTPVYKYKNIVTLLFDTIVAGFEILSNRFPGYIKFVMHQG